MRELRFVMLVMLVVIGCGESAPETAPQDESSDTVERSEPEITSVTTARGFTQIPQGTTVSLVIRGKKLQHTTSVAIGDSVLSLDSVSARELHVTVFGFSPTTLGPLDVSVTSEAGTTVAPGAIERTPIVVSPSAVEGDGTFQSPSRLCDVESDTGGPGIFLVLLAGTHRCGRLLQLTAGTTVQGDPSQRTIVRGTDTEGFGFAIDPAGGPVTTTLRDLTLAAPVAFASISPSFGVGQVVVERVVSAGPISAIGDAVMTIDHYTYDGEGNGIELSVGTITNSTIRHCGAGDGITISPLFGFSNVTIDHVVVKDCARGLVANTGQVTTTITNSRFTDNRIGMQLLDGLHTIRDTVIRDDAMTPQASLTGISINRAEVFATDVKITGQRDAAISIVQTSSDSHAASLFGDGLVLVGGRIGIAFIGIDNHLSLRNSTVRDQTEAALLIQSLDGPINLGDAFTPGNNALSIVTGFVIDDQREFNRSFDKYIQAVGTTLNGVRFDGETVDGPAELAPFYRIISDESGIQF
ncbi:MAG: right-handed parallel beta-helix repeat-containing protein [Kofleriaceae bacterium]